MITKDLYTALKKLEKEAENLYRTPNNYDNDYGVSCQSENYHLIRVYIDEDYYVQYHKNNNSESVNFNYDDLGLLDLVNIAIEEGIYDEQLLEAEKVLQKEVEDIEYKHKGVGRGDSNFEKLTVYIRDIILNINVNNKRKESYEITIKNITFYSNDFRYGLREKIISNM